MTSHEDIFANIRGWAPTEFVGFLDQILVFLPDELKYRLKEVIDSLGPEGDSMNRVFELVCSQWRGIQSQERVCIAVVGPAQTGKTKLVNAISENQTDTSNQVFSIVDVRGLEEYLGYDSDRRHKALDRADVIVLVLDARYGLTEMTIQMYEKLRNLERPILVVLNKIDLVDSPRGAVREAKRRLGVRVIAVSALRAETVQRLLKEIAVTHPKALYPLTQNFPDFRQSICKGIVNQAAFACAVVGAIPIPVSDLLPITAIQTGMVLRVAHAFGYHLNRGRARELIPMLVAGAAVREGCHRLRSRFPLHRELIAVSIAGVWTLILGHAAIQYFERFSQVWNHDQPVDWREIR